MKQLRLNQPSTHLILVALISLFIVALHSSHFSGRAYRQDEAWVVHEALVGVQNRGFIDHVTGVFLRVPPEHVIQDVWVLVAGHHENVVRYLSSLYTLLTLATVYRLTSDLYTKSAGILALFVLGTLNFFMFFSHEARAYPALVFGVAGFSLFFLRYIKHQRLIYGVLALIVAIVALYQHSYMVYVLALNLLFFLLLVRWNWSLLVRVVILYVLIGLAYLPRFFVVFFSDDYGGGLQHALQNDWASLQLLYEQMILRPEGLGLLLILVALIAPLHRRLINPRDGRFRLNPIWRKIYAIGIPLGILVLSFAVNVYVANVTPRNLIVILPFVAIVLGATLAYVDRYVRFAVIAILLVPAVTDFRPLVANGPYHEIVSILDEERSAGERVIVDGVQVWEHVPLIYYLERRLQNPVPVEDQLHLMIYDPATLATIPIVPPNLIHNALSADESQQITEAFFADVDSFWWIRSGELNPDGWHPDEALPEFIATAYHELVDGQEWPHYVAQYRRTPDNREVNLAYGDALQLIDWSLVEGGTLAPCDTVTMHSWWLTEAQLPANYSLSLTLTTLDGAPITQSDSPIAQTETQLWSPDRFYFDQRQLTAPCDLPAGQYMLLLSVYDYETGERLPAFSAGSSDAVSSAYLTTLTVEVP